MSDEQLTNTSVIMPEMGGSLVPDFGEPPPEPKIEASEPESGEASEPEGDTDLSDSPALKQIRLDREAALSKNKETDDGVQTEDEGQEGTEEGRQEEVEPEPKKKSNKADNIKNLREALDKKDERISTLESKHSELESALESMGGFAEVSKAIEEKDARIAELEKYEKLFALNDNPEFKAQYVDSVEKLVGEALEIAKDYEVSETVVAQAINVSSRKELHQILKDNFDDPIAIDDIRGVIGKIQSIQKERAEYEANASDSLGDFQKMHQDRLVAQKSEAQEKIAKAKDLTWNETLKRYQTGDSMIHELTQRGGDQEHNETIKPILDNSKLTFNKVIDAFVDAGASNISPSLVQQVASLSQLAFVAQYAIAGRDHYFKQARELQETNKELSEHSRPSGKTKNRAAKSRVKSKEKLRGKERGYDLINKAKEQLAS